LKRFEYFAPVEISEALKYLESYGDAAKLLAGGTDLLIQLKNNEIKPSYLIDLKKIQELKGIKFSVEEGLRLYPLTTISEIEASQVIENYFPIVSQAIKTIGSIQIRNRATVGGNLCRAAPSADLVPPLLVLDAQLKIRNFYNEKIIKLEEFFVGPGKTILKNNEILTEIMISNVSNKRLGIYLKHGYRQTMELAIVGMAVLMDFDHQRCICKDVKIALGSVAPTPLRAKEAENTLKGEKITQDIIEKAGKVASEETNPITDVYGPDWYKRDIVKVMLKRAIMILQGKIKDQKNET